jgi:hypothetical protein
VLLSGRCAGRGTGVNKERANRAMRGLDRLLRLETRLAQEERRLAQEERRLRRLAAAGARGATADAEKGCA